MAPGQPGVINIAMKIRRPADDKTDRHPKSS